LTRIYDSLEADRSQDFGHGWKLAFGRGRVQESVKSTGGSEWIFGTVPMKPGTRVHITNPDGRRVGFTLQLELYPNPLGPGVGMFGTVYAPKWVPDPGVYDKLESDYLPLNLKNGNLYLYFINFVYNPTQYKLTRRDGTVWRYDQFQDLLDVTDRNGNKLEFRDNGVFHSSGARIEFVRDSAGRIAKVLFPKTADINGPKSEILYTYDSAGDLIRVTDAAGRHTSFAYHPAPHAHYLHEILDPDGNPIAITEYDTKGRLKDVTDANGVMTAIFYDEANRTETRVAAMGTPDEATTVVTYDANGNIVKTVNPIGAITENEYADPRHPNLPTKIVPPCNCPSYKTYDARGNELTSTDALGKTTRSTYDADNNITSRTDPNGHTVSFGYDEKSSLTKIVDAEGYTAHFEYDSTGRIVKVVDALGKEVVLAYPAVVDLLQLDKPGRIVLPNGKSFELAYNIA
jgi:YD repeat-containing protein